MANDELLREIKRRVSCVLEEAKAMSEVVDEALGDASGEEKRGVKIEAAMPNGDGAIICEDDCVYSRECANHTSAGEFRSEGGFTPELSVNERMECFCRTKERPVSLVHNDPLPTGLADGRGMVVIRGGKLTVYQGMVDML